MCEQRASEAFINADVRKARAHGYAVMCTSSSRFDITDVVRSIGRNQLKGR